MERIRISIKITPEAWQALQNEMAEKKLRLDETTLGDLISERLLTPQRATEKPDAQAFFTSLCGASFVAKFAEQLEQWHEDYAPDVLRLGWRFAPTLRKGTHPVYNFVDLLCGSLPWPEPLRILHEQHLMEGTQQVEPEERPPAPIDTTQEYQDAQGKIVRIVFYDDQIITLQNLQNGRTHSIRRDQQNSLKVQSNRL